LAKFRFAREIPQTTQFSLMQNCYCIWEEETRIQHSTRIAKSSKHAHTFTNGALSPRVYLQVLAVRAPRDLYTLAISQEFYKERKTLL
jgi:hypothetical protein